MPLLQMMKLRHAGDLAKSHNAGSPASSPGDGGKPKELGFAGMQNPAPADASEMPSLPRHPGRAEPASQLPDPGCYLKVISSACSYGNVPWEGNAGVPAGCLQTRGTGNTYCNSSKISYTSYPARSRTYHTAGSRSRLLMDKGSEIPVLSAGGGPQTPREDDATQGSRTRSGGHGTEESSSARKPRGKAGPVSQHPGISHRWRPPPYRVPHQFHGQPQSSPNTPGFWSQQWENLF